MLFAPLLSRIRSVGRNFVLSNDVTWCRVTLVCHIFEYKLYCSLSAPQHVQKCNITSGYAMCGKLRNSNHAQTFLEIYCQRRKTFSNVAMIGNARPTQTRPEMCVVLIFHYRKYYATYFNIYIQISSYHTI